MFEILLHLYEQLTNYTLRSTKMKNRMFSCVITMLLLLFFASVLSFAQNGLTRFEKQHKEDYQSLIKKNLKTVEKMLVQHLRENNTNSKLSAVQTIRELENIFPVEPFDMFITPLSNIVTNENSDTQLRVLSAVALDALHSDVGDAAIYEMAKNSKDKSVKNICTAISFETSKTVKESVVKSK